MKIIGVTGKKFAGKDTICDYLEILLKRKGVEVIRESFANGFKPHIQNMFGFTDQQMTDPLLKETVDERWGLSPRYILQTFGTEYGRTFLKPDVWIKSLQLRLNDGINNLYNPRNVWVLISDLRFDNEGEYIVERSGNIIEVKRNTDYNGYNNHQSENGISDKYSRNVINNTGTIEKLKQQIDNVFEEIYIEWEERNDY